jgi:hypothetical protein
MVKETANWRQATMAWLDRPSTMAGAASSSTTALRLAQMAAARLGAPPPSAESAREAFTSWINDGGLLGIHPIKDL